MNDDIIDVEVIGETTTPEKPKSRRGGARPGAGRKPVGWVPPPMKMSYDEAKARNETAKAQLGELEVRIKTGQYVSREVVRDVVATALSAISQRLRSLPDLLERRASMTTEQVETTANEIDDALGALAEQLERELG